MYYSFRKFRFGFEVKVKRESLGFTLHDMEVITEINDSLLSRIECGKRVPMMGEFLALCNVLEMTPSKYFTKHKE